MISDSLRATSSYNVANSLMGINGSDTDNVAAGGIDFSQILTESLGNVRNKLKHGETMSANALLKNANMADVVTAISEADTTLKNMINIRDKVIAAYMDILKMPI